MFLLILESLGSTELVFILLMALIFFGPRKLPQIGRSLGKHVAEFRKASEDFKRTWEKEVAMETTQPEVPISHEMLPQENSILNVGSPEQSTQLPFIEAVPAEQIVPRQTGSVANDTENDDASPNVTDHLEPSRKRDWL